MSSLNGVPKHISFTPNGNRRHARLENISLHDSYIEGAMRALEVVGWAQEIGSTDATLFGLSCENLDRRTQDELDALQDGACQFFDMAHDSGVKIHPFGKIEMFADDPRYARLYERLAKLRADTRESEFTVHVAANYSGKPEHELVRLMDELYVRGFEEVRRDPMSYLLSGGVPPVDLAIRTGGEHRISGFLPFQMAYAELYFTPVLWAEFDRAHFNTSIAWFREQPRNFGK